MKVMDLRDIWNRPALFQGLVHSKNVTKWDWSINDGLNVVFGGCFIFSELTIGIKAKTNINTPNKIIGNNVIKIICDFLMLGYFFNNKGSSHFFSGKVKYIRIKPVNIQAIALK